MSLLQKIGRRYISGEGGADVTKPTAVDGSKGNGQGKRRALGDITNAYAGEEAKAPDNAAKKPIFSSLLSMGYSSTENAADAASYPNTARDSEREYMNREADDIDARDAGNPLLATCYVNEMYQHFNALERQYAVNANYMANQPYVNERMRAILVDWLVRPTACLLPCCPYHTSPTYPFYSCRSRCTSSSRWCRRRCT